MFDKLSHNSVNEAYCLISAYLREDKIGANYNKEHLKEFLLAMADALKDPNNFGGSEVLIEDTGNSKPVAL